MASRNSRKSKKFSNAKNLSVEEGRDAIAESAFANEREFEKWVIRVLTANGWRISSMKDSRAQMWGTHAGIPDIVAVRPQTGELLFAELKVGKNVLSDRQKEWLSDLGDAEAKSPNVIVGCFRPKHRDLIIDLAGGNPPI